MSNVSNIFEDNPSMFFNNGECKEHREDGCSVCINKVLKNKNNKQKSLALIEVATDKNASTSERMNVGQDFEKTVEFVKEALDYTDIGINRVKVVDLPDLMEKAKSEITVGKMRKFIAPPDLGKQGVVGGAWTRFKMKVGW